MDVLVAPVHHPSKSCREFESTSKRSRAKVLLKPTHLPALLPSKVSLHAKKTSVDPGEFIQTKRSRLD